MGVRKYQRTSDEEVVLEETAIQKAEEEAEKVRQTIAASASGASSSGAGPAGASAGHIDDDVTMDRGPGEGGGSAGSSLGKLEMLRSAREQVKEYYSDHMLDENFDKDTTAISDALVQLAAIDVAEVYSPKRVTGHHAFGMRTGLAVDLTTRKADGAFWDLSQETDQKELEQLINDEEPKLLIGSPPCTAFSVLQRLNKGKDTGEKEAMKHLEYSCKLYKMQLAAGRHFLHEHPRDATSWSKECIQELERDARVFCVVGPMCRFGMKQKDKQGAGFVRKETRWLTTSWYIAEALKGSCPGGHRHIRCWGGDRSVQAQVYPPKLCAAILEGLRRQLLASREVSAIQTFASGPHCDGPELQDEEFEDDGGCYVDDGKGQILNKEQVLKARRLEMEWIRKQGVYTVVDVKEAYSHQKRLYDMKWVDVQKTKDMVRSRLVVREIKARKTGDEKLGAEEVFAAMPPVEGLKALVSHMQTEKFDDEGNFLEMLVLDVSRAHFYGASRRKVYTTLPEGHEEEGKCALLLKTMYGTEDAASVWHETWSSHIVSQGYALGRASPALFHGIGVRGLCHGDDFITVGSRRSLEKFEKVLSAKFEIRRTGHIGYADEFPEVQTIDILKREVRLYKQNAMIEIEADRRHVQVLVRDFGLETAKVTATPRVRLDEKELEKIAETTALDRERQQLYRSGLMRAAYIGADRPDISEAVKCLAQHMSSPREGHLQLLKRVIRYLKGTPRLALQYPQQSRKENMFIDVFVDSDWAGCVGTRRSTTGMALMRGRHSLRHGSALQQAIGLSSGEAEYYALTKGASYGLGTQAFFEDWDLRLALRVHSDSSSAKAFAKRLGLGRQRHVQTRFLWLQERVRRRHLSVLHIEGKKNPADLFTKALTRNEIIMHSERLGGKFYDTDDGAEASMQSLRVISPWAAGSRRGPRGGDDEEETPQRGQTPRGHVSRRSPRGEQIAPLSDDEEKPTKACEGSHSRKTAEKKQRGDAEAVFSMASMKDDDSGCFSGQPPGRSRGMIREVGSRGMIREDRLEVPFEGPRAAASATTAAALSTALLSAGVGRPPRRHRQTRRRRVCDSCHCLALFSA